jgi:hypothetical protein
MKPIDGFLGCVVALAQARAGQERGFHGLIPKMLEA